MTGETLLFQFFQDLNIASINFKLYLDLSLYIHIEKCFWLFVNVVGVMRVLSYVLKQLWNNIEYFGKFWTACHINDFIIELTLRVKY